MGWNWTNSGSAMRAPASAASASPSPVTTRGLVVTRIEPAKAAGGQDGRRGDDLAQRPALLDQRAAHAAVGVLQRARDAGAGAHLDVGRGHGGGGDGAHDLAAGLVALHPGDAGAAVGGLQALHEAAAVVAVEGDAQRGEAADGVRPFAGEQKRHVRIDQARRRRRRCRRRAARGCRPAPSAAAMPPCAQADEQPESSGPADSTMVLRGAAASAAESPARPAPTMSTPSISDGHRSNGRDRAPSARRQVMRMRVTSALIGRAPSSRRTAPR